MAKLYSMDLRERAMARLAACGWRERPHGRGGIECCCIERYQMGGARAASWQRRAGAQGRSSPLRHQR